MRLFTGDVLSPVWAPNELPQVFSAGAETQLRDALTNHASTWDDERQTLIRAVLERLREEAHERGLGPEKMWVTAKAAMGCDL